MTAASTVHRIVAGPWEENCYVISASGGDAVVVDPGGAVKAIAAHVDSNGLRPHAVLATHGHHDHVGAAGEIADRYDIPFCVHSAESALLRRASFFRFAFHGLGPVTVPEIGLDLADVAELAFGELRIDVLPTPGHSPGSVCFAVPGALLTGDALATTELGRVKLSGADDRARKASIERLVADHPPETIVYPGHGPPLRLDTSVAAPAARSAAPA